MSFIAFLLAALLLAITPGPGIAYVVARTVSSGRREGLASCLGTGVGGMAHVLAAALGLSVMVAQSAMAFNMVKYIGAAYLIFLGVRILMREDGTAVSTQTGGSKGAHRALLEGMVVELMNVKTALFFLAFLPQFALPTEPLVPQLVMLGSICVALNTLVDVVAVFAAQKLLASGPARAARARWLTRFSGGTMVGLGIFLGFARRES
ncbi:LysE family translocator [Variovorax guangxiensis]|uniref:LysE family translocator n=1 Tax=Variovorax guangxiensis TaxID=1775474 RepID=A0A502DSC7_9BURK|nr:LysE family translocator [Variovorax guangxiensis]RZL59673.1 MAG: LysE family translocator [Variovorax sp.]TPG24105.1 LysE family translocator [Variovorax ginsengisoli]TPG28355.1 LysE family translocator [Variovorax guangxiensis]